MMGKAHDFIAHRSIGFQLIFQMKRLPAPYENSRCIDTEAPGFKSSLKHFKYYSFSSCKEECFINYVYNKCGCGTIYMNGNYLKCTIQKMKLVVKTPLNTG